MRNKILFIFTFAILITSCQGLFKNKQDIIQDNISSELKERMHNPDSFEFVNMRIKKTITVGERKKTITPEKLKEVYELTGSESELYKQYQTELKFLNNQNDDSFEAVYYVDFIARGTNSLGATIKKDYSATVLNDEKLTVVRLK